MPKYNTALDRLPPQAIEAELAVLGCCMIAPGLSTLTEVRGIVSAQDFFRTGHRAIFSAMCRLADDEKPVDVLMVAQELETAGLADATGGRGHLTLCIDSAPVVSRAGVYARLVAEKAQLRELIDRCGELIGLAYEEQDLGSALDAAEGKLAQVRERAKASRGGMVLRDCYEADALMTETLPSPKWAVPEVIPEGLTILCGSPKIGKSWMALQLALSVASGGVALGRVPVEKGAVLYLAMEDRKRRLQSRIRVLMDGEPCPAGLTLANQWAPMAHGGVLEMEEWLLRHPGARLILIDTLARVRGGRNLRANVYDEDYTEIVRMKSLADRFGIALLVVHHSNKQQPEDPFDAMSGSHGLTGAADTLLLLRRTRGEREAELWLTGRDVEDSKQAITFASHGGWTLQGDASQFAQTQEQAAVISAIRESGGHITARELAERLNLARNTAKLRLWRMAEKGLLKSIEGVYWAAADGTRENGRNPRNVVTGVEIDPFASTDYQ